MVGEPPLDTIFHLRDDLIKFVRVLEGRSTTHERNRALRGALRLVCDDLRQFTEYRFARLHKAMKWRYIWRRFGRADIILGDATVQADFETCDRIGRALDAATGDQWKVRENLVDCYRFLMERLAAQGFAPLTKADLPANLRQLCDDACHLAGKLGTSGPISDRDRRTAGLIARKALATTVILSALISLEQDIVPFSKDMVRVVKVLAHGIDRLVNDDMFIVPLAPPEPGAPDNDGHGRRPPDLPGPDGPSTPRAPTGEGLSATPGHRPNNGASRSSTPPPPKRMPLGAGQTPRPADEADSLDPPPTITPEPPRLEDPSEAKSPNTGSRHLGL